MTPGAEFPEAIKGCARFRGGAADSDTGPAKLAVGNGGTALEAGAASKFRTRAPGVLPCGKAT